MQKEVIINPIYLFIRIKIFSQQWKKKKFIYYALFILKVDMADIDKQMK